MVLVDVRSNLRGQNLLGLRGSRESIHSLRKMPQQHAASQGLMSRNGCSSQSDTLNTPLSNLSCVVPTCKICRYVQLASAALWVLPSSQRRECHDQD